MGEGPTGRGWVDPPEVPDARTWSPAGDGRATAPRRSGPPSRPARTPAPSWLRVLVVVGLLLVTQQLTRRPPADLLQGRPDSTVLARYAAAEGALGELVDGEHEPSAVALWDEWVALVPAHHSRRVEVFEITSDGVGPGTFAAFVAPLDEDGERWRLVVDPVDHAERPEHYSRTLVHELSHIITLSGVLDGRHAGSLAEATAQCRGPAIVHGCVDPTSLLGRWIERFWTAEDIAAADAMRRVDGRIADPGAQEARYAEVRSRFVSRYATTAPEEDIAESIEAFAFGDPQPLRSEAAEKLDLLREDPAVFALVDALRQQLRG